ncbi:unnamed protein product, partial [Prorocentrum cordatum]
GSPHRSRCGAGGRASSRSARTPRVRVIAVSDRIGYTDPGGTEYSTCATAESLRRQGGGLLGVLGLGIARLRSRRATAFWRWAAEHYLGRSLPEEMLRDVTTIIPKFSSLMILLLLEQLRRERGDTLVLYVDAFDVLFQRNLSELPAEYCAQTVGGDGCRAPRRAPQTRAEPVARA